MKKRKTKYLPSVIEEKWQELWRKNKLHTFKRDSTKKKFYTLVELPYPSGDLHIGHWFTFTTPDVLSRFKRMMGYNVFFPHGYDAFGLPAENAAIKRHVHPQDWTIGNISSMSKQFKTMGTMIDFTRITTTCLPDYYTWNQWIFIFMFNNGLAYRGKTLSNWCEKDQTVLANENVENGKCWRCGTQVVQKEISQWFLKITDYADSLVWPKNPSVDWPKSVTEGQNNWIGKSQGMEITFPVENFDCKISVYTVFPETIFGVTYIVLAPEHSFVNSILSKKSGIENHRLNQVREYVTKARKKSQEQRLTTAKQKTGVFTGLYCINEVNKEKIPLWIAEYVIGSYGTGAVMGVPASDVRDFDFAKKYNLLVKQVISKTKEHLSEIRSKEDVLEEGYLVNSSSFNGLSTPNPAREEVKKYLEEKTWGKRTTKFHLHDWSISRQRYWGTPIPIIHCDSCGMVPVALEDLPVTLPYDVDYTPKGKPPLASNESWLNVSCPACGKPAKRDAETMDTFFDSSWYYYRYVDPTYKKGPFDKKKVTELLPVNVYFGGAEHTLGHTLYARFFTKFFNYNGLIPFNEFALKRIQHGIVLGPDGNKMSKSRGNVINPDDVVKEYGADSVRLYLTFMMPYEATSAWSTSGLYGMFRFLKRTWDLLELVTKTQPSYTDLQQMHRVIKKVTDDLEHIKMNTALATLMEWINYLCKKKEVSRLEYTVFLKLLAPFAPHLTEELWEKLGETFSIHESLWPVYEEKFLLSDKVKLIVQVNGKMRDLLVIDRELSSLEKDVEKKALSSEKISRHIMGKKIKKTVFIAEKVINFVL